MLALRLSTRMRETVRCITGSFIGADADNRLRRISVVAERRRDCCELTIGVHDAEFDGSDIRNADRPECLTARPTSVNAQDKDISAPSWGEPDPRPRSQADAGHATHPWSKVSIGSASSVWQTALSRTVIPIRPFDESGTLTVADSPESLATVARICILCI